MKQGIARAIARSGLSPAHPHAASLHTDASSPFPQPACPISSWPSLYSRQRAAAAVPIELSLRVIHPSGKRLTA